MLFFGVICFRRLRRVKVLKRSAVSKKVFGWMKDLRHSKVFFFFFFWSLPLNYFFLDKLGSSACKSLGNKLFCLFRFDLLFYIYFFFISNFYPCFFHFTLIFIFPIYLSPSRPNTVNVSLKKSLLGGLGFESKY
jgi:hypothetical protein